MSTWVRIATGDNFTYLNLDHVKQAQVVATTSGPAGYTVEFGGDGGADLGAIYGRWDTAAHADAALQLLLRGTDLSATAGEEA